MLLMAAAQVVDGKDYTTTDKFDTRKRNSSTYSIEEARRRDAYPNGRYYPKPGNKRIRTSPPTPAPTYNKVDTRRKHHRSTQVTTIATGQFCLFAPKILIYIYRISQLKAVTIASLCNITRW